MAEFIKLYEENPNPRQIAKVVEVLKRGGLIIYPTDTVYGLGCDINNIKALQRIAQIKGVKLEKAHFSFICKDLSNLSDYVKHISNSTFKILKRTLPGPFTFILPGAKTLPSAFKKKKTVGIRVPDNPITLAIIEELGNPIVSISIRDKDEIVEYTTDPELIYDNWKHKVDLIIDGGIVGNEPSTIVDVSDGEVTIIREGKGDVDLI